MSGVSLRVTSRIDYGLRAMLDLALRHGAGPVQNGEISRRQQIPEQYLKQLLPALRRAALIQSVRGPLGGHRLARAPESIHVAEVIQALDGHLDLLEVGPADGARHDSESRRTLTEYWGDLRDHLRGFLESTTLEDLCRRTRQREQSFTFHI